MLKGIQLLILLLVAVAPLLSWLLLLEESREEEPRNHHDNRRILRVLSDETDDNDNNNNDGFVDDHHDDGATMETYGTGDGIFFTLGPKTTRRGESSSSNTCPSFSGCDPNDETKQAYCDSGPRTSCSWFFSMFLGTTKSRGPRTHCSDPITVDRRISSGHAVCGCCSVEAEGETTRPEYCTEIDSRVDIDFIDKTELPAGTTAQGETEVETEDGIPYKATVQATFARSVTLADVKDYIAYVTCNYDDANDDESPQTSYTGTVSITLLEGRKFFAPEDIFPIGSILLVDSDIFGSCELQPPLAGNFVIDSDGFLAIESVMAGETPRQVVIRGRSRTQDSMFQSRKVELKRIQRRRRDLLVQASCEDLSFEAPNYLNNEDRENDISWFVQLSGKNCVEFGIDVIRDDFGLYGMDFAVQFLYERKSELQAELGFKRKLKAPFNPDPKPISKLFPLPLGPAFDSRKLLGRLVPRYKAGFFLSIDGVLKLTPSAKLSVSGMYRDGTGRNTWELRMRGLWEDGLPRPTFRRVGQHQKPPPFGEFNPLSSQANADFKVDAFFGLEVSVYLAFGQTKLAKLAVESGFFLEGEVRSIAGFPAEKIEPGKFPYKTPESVCTKKHLGQASLMVGVGPLTAELDIYVDPPFFDEVRLVKSTYKLSDPLFPKILLICFLPEEEPAPAPTPIAITPPPIMDEPGDSDDEPDDSGGDSEGPNDPVPTTPQSCPSEKRPTKCGCLSSHEKCCSGNVKYYSTILGDCPCGFGGNLCIRGTCCGDWKKCREECPETEPPETEPPETEPPETEPPEPQTEPPKSDAPRERTPPAGGSGDPHMTTFDGLRYDCQAHGEVIVSKSLDSSFEIQGRFSPWNTNPVTVCRGIVVKVSPGDPVVQLTIASNSSAPVSFNGCSVILLVNGIEKELTAFDVPGVSIRTTRNRVTIAYSNVAVVVHIDIHKLHPQCYQNFYVTLPGELSASERIVGLLGTPNGNKTDDWTTLNGTLWQHSGRNRRAEYDYCRKSWCITERNASIFAYEPGFEFTNYSFCHLPYDDYAERAIERAPQEVKDFCGNDENCILDGVEGGAEMAEQYVESNAELLKGRNISGQCFGSSAELRTAVNEYLRGTNKFYAELTEKYGWPLGNWCVDHITDFSYLFSGASDFNEDISGWNTSSAVNMNSMFYQASSFNIDISGWDVSHVTTMVYMFRFASSFRQNLCPWGEDLFNRTVNTHLMLDQTNCSIHGSPNLSLSPPTPLCFSCGDCFKTKGELSTAVNQYLAGDTEVAQLYGEELGDWCVDHITDFSYLFSGKQGFNEDISGWNTSSAVNMNSMFYQASSFNIDISGWDVSHVTTMVYMFRFASSFRQNLCPWGEDLFNRTVNTHLMLDQTNCSIHGSPNLSLSPPTPLCFSCGDCFKTKGELSTAVNQYLAGDTEVAHLYGEELGDWCVDHITDFSYLFSGKQGFNEDVSGWNTSSAVNMDSMFYQASSFNIDISGWDVSHVTTMVYMFRFASSFRQNLCPWGEDLFNRTVNTHLMLDRTNCPIHGSPNLSSSPPTPVCFSCPRLNSNATVRH